MLNYYGLFFDRRNIYIYMLRTLGKLNYFLKQKKEKKAYNKSISISSDKKKEEKEEKSRNYRTNLLIANPKMDWQLIAFPISSTREKTKASSTHGTSTDDAQKLRVLRRPHRRGWRNEEPWRLSPWACAVWRPRGWVSEEGRKGGSRAVERRWWWKPGGCVVPAGW